MFILRGGWPYGGTVSSKSQSPPINRRVCYGKDLPHCHPSPDQDSVGLRTITAVRLSLIWEPKGILKNPISVIALSGQSLSHVTHTTGSIRLVTSGNHTKDIHLFQTNSPSVPVVLGHPLLTLHKPHINWGLGLQLTIIFIVDQSIDNFFRLVD